VNAVRTGGLCLVQRRVGALDQLGCRLAAPLRDPGRQRDLQRLAVNSHDGLGDQLAQVLGDRHRA
jgi:hypothetical protein